MANEFIPYYVNAFEKNTILSRINKIKRIVEKIKSDILNNQLYNVKYQDKYYLLCIDNYSGKKFFYDVIVQNEIEDTQLVYNLKGILTRRDFGDFHVYFDKILFDILTSIPTT